METVLSPRDPEIPETISLNLSPEQVQDLTILLNVSLRNTRLGQDHATRLNDLFVQLVGKNHDVWEAHGGEYYPEIVDRTRDCGN